MSLLQKESRLEESKARVPCQGNECKTEKDPVEEHDDVSFMQVTTKSRRGTRQTGK